MYDWHKKLKKQKKEDHASLTFLTNWTHNLNRIWAILLPTFILPFLFLFFFLTLFIWRFKDRKSERKWENSQQKSK